MANGQTAGARAVAPPDDGRRGRAGRALARMLRHEAVEFGIALLILVSVAGLLAEVALPVTDPRQPVLIVAGELFTILFAVELTLRWLCAARTGEFLGEYWLDVLSVFPLLRPLRFLRLLRLLRLFRASVMLHRRSRRFLGTLTETSGEYFLLAAFLFTVTTFAALAIMQIEGHRAAEFRTLGGALWWAILSMATGQPTQTLPESNLGKSLALFVVLSGQAVFAMVTGIVSAIMVERLRRRMDEKELKLEELTGHIVICGWNRSGNLLVQELQRDPRHARTPIVIAAEFQPQESIDFTGLKAELLYIVRGDYTKVALLHRTNLCSASMVVILADQVVFRSDQDLDARTVLAALTIEKLAPGVFTCVELLNSDNESHLKMAGVEEVIIHDVFRADVLAVACLNRGLGHVIHDLLSRGDGTGFFTADVPASWIGLELDLVFGPLKRSADAVVVGLIGSGGVVANPPLSTRFSAGDRLVLVAARAPDLATVPVPPRPPPGRGSR